MKQSILRFSIAAVFFVLLGCNSDQEDSPILVFLNPESPQVEANSGERIFFTVNASSRDGSELNLSISSQDDTYGIVDVFDSTFTRTNINYRLEYKVPSYDDSTQSLLIFRLENDLNQSVEIASRILINRGERFLEEASGLDLFSAASNRPDALNLESLQLGFSSDTASFVADVKDFTVDSDTLSRVWVSDTELSFVKFNGFNYAEASSQSIRNAYSEGVKISRATNIQNSDIFLVGRGNDAVAAIQVIAVTDFDGREEDKYTISIKRISN